MRLRLDTGDPPQGVWIGEKHYLWAEVAKFEDVDTTLDSGYHLQWKQRAVRFRFENGLALSVIWGGSTYSSNYDWPFLDEWVEEPDQVECGLLRWSAQGEVGAPPEQAYAEGGLLGDPLGWCSVSDLAELLDRVAALPSSTDKAPEWWDYWHEEHDSGR